MGKYCFYVYSTYREQYYRGCEYNEYGDAVNAWCDDTDLAKSYAIERMAARQAMECGNDCIVISSEDLEL